MRFTSCMHYSHIFNVIGQVLFKFSVFHVLPCIHTYSTTQTSAGGCVCVCVCFACLLACLFVCFFVCLFVSLVNSNSSISALKTLPCTQLFHQTLTRPILSQAEESGVQTVAFAACRIKLCASFFTVRSRHCGGLETTVARYPHLLVSLLIK